MQDLESILKATVIRVSVLDKNVLVWFLYGGRRCEATISLSIYRADILQGEQEKDGITFLEKRGKVPPELSTGTEIFVYFDPQHDYGAIMNHPYKAISWCPLREMRLEAFAVVR